VKTILKRKVVFPSGIKINNTLYSNILLKDYVGDDVLIKASTKRKDKVIVRNTEGKIICLAEVSIIYPKQERKNHRRGKL